MATHQNPFLYLQRNADTNPGGIFSQSAEQRMTNAEAVVSVKKLAYEMRRLGVKAGDVVALALPDQLSILFTEAVYHEAAISVVLPEKYSADGVFQIDWVFCRETPVPQGGAQVVVVDSRFLQLVDQNPYGISPSNEPIETLRIVLTSGTTGTPNPIALGREMEQAMEVAVDIWFRGGPYLILMDTGTAWGFGELYLSVKGGTPYLCPGGASLEAIVRIAAENSVKSLKGSPAQIAAVVDELERQQRTLPSVETIFMGGTVVAPGLTSRLHQVTEGCMVFSNYGSTEAGGATIRSYETDDPFDAGHVMPGSSLEIVDEDDRALPDGDVGRIRYKSPGMVHAYLGNPEASSRAFKDGWFYPGDLGFVRPDRGLTLTGRESELLNAGGVKIDPFRIDHFAIRSPKVIDACSFGYETASGLLQIGLALVTDDDFDVDVLLAELAAEFGSTSPKLIARVDAIPRTAAGKPLRRALAERYKES
jgi:acyl-coenzyme A synthetase/AMP-(fatty) acid ligase